MRRRRCCGRLLFGMPPPGALSRRRFLPPPVCANPLNLAPPSCQPSQTQTQPKVRDDLSLSLAHNLAAQSFKTGITYDTKIRGKKTQFKVFVGGGCCCLLLMCVCC